MSRQTSSILLLNYLCNYLIKNNKQNILSLYVYQNYYYKKKIFFLPNHIIKSRKNINFDSKDIKKTFNKLRNNFSKEEIKKIRRKFYFTETVSEYLKELEEKDSLTMQETKKIKKSYTKKLQKAEECLKILNKHLKKLKRHRYNIIEDIEYKEIKEIQNLFNIINEEDYCKPIKIKHSFDDDYIEYESR